MNYTINYDNSGNWRVKEGNRTVAYFVFANDAEEYVELKKAQENKNKLEPMLKQAIILAVFSIIYILLTIR